MKHALIFERRKEATCTQCGGTWKNGGPVYDCPGIKAYRNGNRPSHLLTIREIKQFGLVLPCDALPEGAIRVNHAWAYLYAREKCAVAHTKAIVVLRHRIVGRICTFCGQVFDSKPHYTCPLLHMYEDEDCPPHLITLPELRLKGLRPGSVPEAVLRNDVAPGWLCLYDAAKAEPARYTPRTEPTEEGEDELEELEELEGDEEPIDTDEVLTNVIQ